MHRKAKSLNFVPVNKHNIKVISTPLRGGAKFLRPHPFCETTPTKLPRSRPTSSRHEQSTRNCLLQSDICVKYFFGSEGVLELSCLHISIGRYTVYTVIPRYHYSYRFTNAYVDGITIVYNVLYTNRIRREAGLRTNTCTRDVAQSTVRCLASREF